MKVVITLAVNVYGAVAAVTKRDIVPTYGKLKNERNEPNMAYQPVCDTNDIVRTCPPSLVYKLVDDLRGEQCYIQKGNSS